MLFLMQTCRMFRVAVANLTPRVAFFPNEMLDSIIIIIIIILTKVVTIIIVFIIIIVMISLKKHIKVVSLTRECGWRSRS